MGSFCGFCGMKIFSASHFFFSFDVQEIEPKKEYLKNDPEPFSQKKGVVIIPLSARRHWTATMLAAVLLIILGLLGG